MQIVTETQLTFGFRLPGAILRIESKLFLLLVYCKTSRFLSTEY